MKRNALRGWAIGALLLVAGLPVHAHHSFATYFDPDRTVSVRGEVVEFQFRNPHGLIRLEVKDAHGREIWGGETNAATILAVAGWTRDSLKIGETVTMDGWPSRDGSRYLRVQRVLRADGTPVGMP